MFIQHNYLLPICLFLLFSGCSDAPAALPEDGGIPPNHQCIEIYGVPVADAFSPDTILLGALIPFSGALSEYGPNIGLSIKLAVDEINQSGGIFNKQLAVLFLSSALSCPMG